MSQNYLEEIVNNHRSKGMLDAYEAVTIIDDSLIKYNKYTLRIYRMKASTIDIDYYNAQIKKYLKANTDIYKEIREFNQLFRFFDRLKIKSGYIKKTETPDFELFKDGNSYGIEVTRIYTTNDWVAEKIHNDISAYKLTGQTLKEYMSHSKYSQRIKASVDNDRVKIEAVKSEEFKDEEIIQIKNKIFEKIRKQMDDYQKFDINYIFAEIVYSGYKEIKSYDVLNNEIQYLVSHLDGNYGNIDFHLFLKNGNRIVDFNIKEGTFHDI